VRFKPRASMLEATKTNVVAGIALLRSSITISDGPEHFCPAYALLTLRQIYWG
jgi:hypothetical protein